MNIRYILTIIATLMAMTLSAQTSAYVRPAFLKPGDKIAVISPASTPDKEYVDGGIEVLRQWGLDPVLGNYVLAENGSFAGTVTQRKDDLEWAFSDPTIKAIICSRGGYGAIQELLRFNPEVIKNNPKWIVGYSDITALHGAMVNNGVMSIHAHMLEHLNDTKGEDPSSVYLKKMLFGELPTYHIDANPYNKPGEVQGTLMGGNLVLITSLIGTDFSFFNVPENIILFIEDVDENLERVNRMIYHLIATGDINKVKGLIVGNFKGAEKNSDFDDVNQMIDTLLQNYNIPICYNFPCGHCFDNYPLIEGATVTLKVTDNDGATLTFE